MRSLLIASLLMLCGMLRAESNFELPPVTNAWVSAPYVLLMHTDNSTTICECGDLTVVDWSTHNEFGYPTFFLVEGEGGNPSTLETEWTDADGLSHRVRTPCRDRGADACADWHRVQVRAMLRAFPQATRTG